MPYLSSNSLVYAPDILYPEYCHILAHNPFCHFTAATLYHEFTFCRLCHAYSLKIVILRFCIEIHSVNGVDTRIKFYDKRSAYQETLS